jgi:hypothetical protein
MIVYVDFNAIVNDILKFHRLELSINCFKTKVLWQKNADAIKVLKFSGMGQRKVFPGSRPPGEYVDIYFDLAGKS